MFPFLSETKVDSPSQIFSTLRNNTSDTVESGKNDGNQCFYLFSTMLSVFPKTNPIFATTFCKLSADVFNLETTTICHLISDKDFIKS